jgi:pyruvate,water dikinase
MMTGDIKPLGMSFFEFLSDIPLSRAGGRLFLDVSGFLASPIGRRMLPMAWAAIRIYRKNDPSIIKDLVARNEGLILDLQQRISAVRGVNLFDFILEDLKRLKDALFYPPNLGAVMAGMFAADGINASMEKWLGEKNAAHALSKSVANNITSEMGLALLDVADIVRRHPDAIEYLRHAGDETLFAGLKEREGGEAVAEALRAYLDKYGMRCPGEIDITRPRLSERPAMLIPLILNEVRNLRPNARNDRFERGRHEAQEKERELLGRLELLPGGRRKAKKAGKMIAIMRNFVGYREYPKYFLMKRFNIYKNALMKEAETLVQGGVIREKEDVFYLTLGELREAVRTNRLDCRIITRRKEEYSAYEKMTPPRVMTSEGEIVSGEYGAGGVPAGALAGLPVSAGVREGRARVVLRMQDADLEEGDILVTEFADPGWTPLFVSVSALVTEAGGLMSHGSVIAREYGLPAVAGVENATRLIKDGQRIRVNGTEGYVEILSNGADSILP